MKTKTIKTRQLNPQAIECIEKMVPVALETQYKKGDYLFMYGISFTMVHYSLESLESGQSVEVSYWSELYDIEINLDFEAKTVSVDQPIVDLRFMGF